ncbi:uncharacterized protein TRIVIDRAFT_65432 [Trichoderma virens Gv29-8]|uniref:Uncharacterized protein n=1 Tax=Hypocrea virens (strain Gv29-8 / FGSC 10586) TaxID=413071 RepID=G9NA57_HYPVG|nr:uncharacterized protein TRIVIDRAFT_65432 [Trichoderma virens Gv29-8]EHK16823.1 hypothetical protein TRIVIDRAFT_65432 [Trichoderma virens Gv29-8]
MAEPVVKQLLASFLPPDVVALIETHILDPRSPIQILKRQALALARRGASTVTPLVQPVAERGMAVLAEHQGALDLLLPLATIVATLVVLNWIRRILLWWTRLAMRAVLWAALVALAAWVYNRGVLVSARDAAVVGAKVMGYIAVLKNVWLDEYKRYEGQQASGRWDEYSARRSGGGMYNQAR